MIDVKPASRRLFTVGHSNHPIERFLGLLEQNGVTTIADVRSAPYSRFAPHFNKEALQATLRSVGLKYVFLGRELGARSSDPSCYEDGRVRYDRLACTDSFRAGLDRLARGSEIETVAILCTEKDPLDCHRTLLVGRSLTDRGFTVDHILEDGSLEHFDDSMLRLLDKTRQPPPNFFMTLGDTIEKALKDQEARIAYVDKELAATERTMTS